MLPDPVCSPRADGAALASLQSPRLKGLYPPSYEMTEPLTKPHTVSVLVLLVLLVGYSGISGMHLAAEEGAPGGDLTNKVIVRFTNIKTYVACETNHVGNSAAGGTGSLPAPLTPSLQTLRHSHAAACLFSSVRCRTRMCPWSRCECVRGQQLGNPTFAAHHKL